MIFLNCSYSATRRNILTVIVVGANANVFFETRSGSLVRQMHILECNHVLPFLQFDRRLWHHFPCAGRHQHHLEFAKVWVEESAKGKST